MESKVRAAASARKSRRRKTLLWTVAVIAVVVTLLVYEQIALLYVLSTFSVVALLIVVGWSNIEGARAINDETPPLDDSAALGSGIAAASNTRAGSSRRKH